MRVPKVFSTPSPSKLSSTDLAAPHGSLFLWGTGSRVWVPAANRRVTKVSAIRFQIGTKADAERSHREDGGLKTQDITNYWLVVSTL